MTLRAIASLRLHAQGISRSRPAGPVEAVAALGGLQAQDYPGALWAIGLRSGGAGEAEVEAAVADGSIVRSWPMRGTLHFTAAADLRWMIRLLGPRSISGDRSRCRQLGIDAAALSSCRRLFIKALEGGRQQSRAVLFGLLEAAGIATDGQRGYHILFNLAQEGLICFAARDGKQQTFALLEEWTPDARILERDEALAELAGRYFSGHGPATLADFVWWSGLTVADARAGLALAAARLARETFEGEPHWFAMDRAPARLPSGAVHLLPAFDEYLLGYKGRAAVLDPRDAGRVAPGGNGLFRPIIVVDGRVAGVWRRVIKNGKVSVSIETFGAMSKARMRDLATAAGRYGRFLGLTTRVCGVDGADSGDD
jgi:hypothetical protein